jgi:predicted Fe-Mo cluster-binding NifX family protein
MKVAVSVNEAGEIIDHLGQTELFHIYEKNGESVEFVEDRLTDGAHQNHLIEEIDDCKAVISGLMGPGMAEDLADLGLEAVEEKETVDPIEAIEKNF